MTENINGICLFMCPEKERWMREREGLLHPFEIDDETRHLKKPKADPYKIIKCFSRSAAGQVMTDPSQLRPGHVLLSTIKYLFTKIVTRTDRDWIYIYDFTFDRLRAVRQDIVIQRMDTATSIQIFELIVRFHTYAAQRLCEKNISEFDPKINNQHLLECIKHLLVLYDEVDKRDKNAMPKLCKNMELKIRRNRSQMEALYILLHIGDVAALKRALALPKRLRTLKDVQLATEISLTWYLKNYVRICRLIEQLPPILICATMCNLTKLRRDALQIMCSGYNNKVLTFPGLKLQRLLLYKDINKIEADCKLFGLTFTNQNVLFQKAAFHEKDALAHTEMYYSSQALHKFLPHILLESLEMPS